MKNIFFALAIILVSSQSFASGGLSCEAENSKVKISIDSTNTHGMFGAPIVSLTAKVIYKQSEGFRDLEEVTYEKSDVVGYWALDNGTKLALHFEDGTDDSFGTVDLTLNTKTNKKDESEESGTVKVVKSINGAHGPSTNSTHTLKITCTRE